jgi:hypothetical protein
MRLLFLLIVLANVWVYAFGQGWVGPKPEDEGRSPHVASQEINTPPVRTGS